MPKKCYIWATFFENLKLAVKQCHLLKGQKLVENANIKNESNATFWIIFKHSAELENMKNKKSEQT